MSNKKNVIAGKPKVGGAISHAAPASPPPPQARPPLPAGFRVLGYAASAGWARQIAKAYETITAWGGDEVNKSRTEHAVTFSVTLIEDLNPEVQRAKWGTAAVTTTPATATHGNLITVTYEGEDTEPGVWVFDMDDQGKLHRTVFMDATDTTESFEQTFSDSEAVGLPFEFTAYRDATTGAFFIDYTDDGQLTA